MPHAALLDASHVQGRPQLVRIRLQSGVVESFQCQRPIVACIGRCCAGIILDEKIQKTVDACNQIETRRTVLDRDGKRQRNANRSGTVIRKSVQEVGCIGEDERSRRFDGRPTDLLRVGEAVAVRVRGERIRSERRLAGV